MMSDKNIHISEKGVTKTISSKRNIRRLFYRSKNKCIKKYFKKNSKTKKLFVELYDYIQRNHYDKFFKFNLKRIYKLEVIIAEVYYMLKNSVSYNNHIGEINGKSLNKYVLFFSNNSIFQKVHKRILEDYVKNKSNRNKTVCIDTCNVTNKECVNDVDLNGSFKEHDDATKKKIINRFNLIKRNKYSKRRLNKEQYTKYNTSLVLGKNKQYNNKKSVKISAITNDHKIPLDVKIYNGARSDSKTGLDQISTLNSEIKANYLLADKGYDSKKIHKECESKNIVPIIPLNKKRTKDKNKILLRKLTKSKKKIYKKRVKVEHFFSILKRYKRLDHIYEKSIQTYESFLYLALTDIIINYKN